MLRQDGGERRNRLVAGKLEVERLHLQPLPPAPVPEYVNYRARVRKWSTIQAAGRTYTAPSRLIGEEVQVRLYADAVEVLYRGHLMERMSGCGASGKPASITGTSSTPSCASRGLSRATGSVSTSSPP